MYFYTCHSGILKFLPFLYMPKYFAVHSKSVAAVVLKTLSLIYVKLLCGQKTIGLKGLDLSIGLKGNLCLEMPLRI